MILASVNLNKLSKWGFDWQTLVQHGFDTFCGARIRQKEQLGPWGSVPRQTGIPEIPTISRYIIHYAVHKYGNYTSRQIQTLTLDLSQVLVASVPPSQFMKKYLGTIPSVRTRITVSRWHLSDGDGLRDTRWAFVKPVIAE